MSIQFVEPMPVQLTPELEQHAQLRGSQFGDQVPDSMNVVQWMQLAEAGMTASTDSQGHITYSLNVSKTRLAADSTYVGVAELTCAVYNALPAESRIAPANIEPAVIANDADCVSHTQEISYWWGGKIHFDHCACNDVELVLGGTVAITSLAAGILGVISGSTTVAPTGGCHRRGADGHMLGCRCRGGNLPSSVRMGRREVEQRRCVPELHVGLPGDTVGDAGLTVATIAGRPGRRHDLITVQRDPPAEIHSDQVELAHEPRSFVRRPRRCTLTRTASRAAEATGLPAIHREPKRIDSRALGVTRDGLFRTVP